MADKRRKPNPAWKGIYGKDRKYTARIDRMNAREAAEDKEAHEILDEARTRYAGVDWRKTFKPL